MNNLTLTEGIVVSLICIFVVFVILAGLYIVIRMFSVIFKEELPVVEKKVVTNVVQPDEESKNVAMLMALILANDDKDNKTYEVVSIENKN